MKKVIALLFALLLIGCPNQLRNLEGKMIKTSASTAGENVVGDGLVVDPSIPTPTMVTATQGGHSDRIRISWKQVFHGDAQIQYHVYRKIDNVTREGGPTFERLTGYRSIAQLYFDDMVSATTKAGVEYSYYVCAVNLSSPGMEVSALSAPAIGYALSAVSVLSASFRESIEKVDLTWDNVEGAAFYYIYRAKEIVENVEPNISSFVKLGKAVTASSGEKSSYTDYSILSGGELESGVSYYYYVEACFDRSTISEKSTVARGCLLTAGAPSGGEVISVSSGDILNAIRVAWKKDPNADSYRIYRISEAEYRGGNYVGTEIPIDNSKLAGTEEQCVWYDNDAKLAGGETFYYRVAAANDYGLGSLSPIAKDDGTPTSGYALMDASTIQPFVMLTASGYSIEWDRVKGTDSYYIFAKEAEGDEPTPPEGDADWEKEIKSAMEPSVVITKDDLKISEELQNCKYYFRVLPYKINAVESYNPTSGSVTLKAPYSGYTEEIKKVLGEEAAKVHLVGRSQFTQNSFFELKPPVIKSFTASKGNTVGTVVVEAELDMNSEIGIFYDVKLKRVCYYGDEERVYPLSLPPANTDPTNHNPLKGIKLKAHTKEYEMKDSFNRGTIHWEDPMPDYTKDGKESGKLFWDYAAWDREAWKCILRKKHVDMNQFVKIKYELQVIDKSNSTVLSTRSDEGWPALSNKEFAFLSKWLVDCALATIWQFNIPRMLWDNTVGWLPSLSFSHNGENGGKMEFSVGSVTNLSGSGGSAGTLYSDWPGYGVKLSMSMRVSLETNQPKQVTLNGIEIQTPLYSGTMDMQFTVRDYGPNWGLWVQPDGTPPAGGYIKVKNGSQGVETFFPSEIIMRGTGNKDIFDYQVHGYDENRDLDPKEKESYFANGPHHTWHFTRINWPGRPYPCNNEYMKSKGNKAAINYNLSAWTAGDRE